jgi:hypothetical protein
MGKTVKDLLQHLRQRQKEFGVNAFRFSAYAKEGKFYASRYPDNAQRAIDAGAEVKDWPILVKEDGQTSHRGGETERLPTEVAEPIQKTITPTPTMITPTPTPTSTPASFIKADTWSQQPSFFRMQFPSHVYPDGQLTARNVTTDGAKSAVNTSNLPTFMMPAGFPFPYSQFFTQVPESGQFKMDPRLWQAAVRNGGDSSNRVPDGDPFAHVKIVNAAQIPTTTPMPEMTPQSSSLYPATAPSYLPNPAPSSGHTPQIKIKPPVFSPASTPSRSPTKRKRVPDVEKPPIPTNSRPKRNITTPKKYADFD